jgi:hypothetical protein
MKFSIALVFTAVLGVSTVASADWECDPNSVMDCDHQKPGGDGGGTPVSGGGGGGGGPVCTAQQCYYDETCGAWTNMYDPSCEVCDTVVVPCGD